MDIIAAFSALVFGLVGVIWVAYVVVEGLRDKVWNARLGFLCVLIILGSVAFLGSSVGILLSGPRLLPPGLFNPA